MSLKMNTSQISIAGFRGNELPDWLLVGLGVAIILWLWSVVVVAREKTEDPFDRIVWLLIVLMLNFVGTLLYFFFAGNVKSSNALEKSEQELKNRANNGTL